MGAFHETGYPGLKDWATMFSRFAAESGRLLGFSFKGEPGTEQNKDTAGYPIEHS